MLGAHHADNADMFVRTTMATFDTQSLQQANRHGNDRPAELQLSRITSETYGYYGGCP